MRDEKQKKTTDEYRTNWDAIFKPKEPVEFDIETENDTSKILATIPFGK